MVNKLMFHCTILALAASSFAGAQGSIKIATAGPITGDDAIWGVQVYQGVEMAVEDINAKGGLLGRKIELVKFDDKGESKEAASVAQRIVNEQDVVAVIGHVFSSCSLAAGPIYSRGKVPMVAVASTNPKVPAAGNYVFRINLSDASAGSEMAKYTVQKLKARRVAVIMGQSDYCQGVFNAFEAKAKELGASIVIQQKFVPGQDKDFNVILTSVKAANPDMILVDAYASDAALITQQARALGIQTTIQIPDGAADPDFIKLAGKAAEGVVAFSYFNPSIKDPRIQGLMKKYQAKYNHEILTYVPYAYDAMTAVAEAVRMAGKADRASVYSALPKVNYSNGMTGPISFLNRDRAVGWSVVLKVQNDKFNYLALTSE
jgi:branched-chain amino acid transport system substrate-binding protein